MTAIENQQLKGVTIKNVVVTIISTASIVATVISSYYNLKTDIQSIKSVQETEARINNLRIAVLENEITLLQKQVNEIKYPVKSGQPLTTGPITTNQSSLIANKSK